MLVNPSFNDEYIGCPRKNATDLIGAVDKDFGGICI